MVAQSFSFFHYYARTFAKFRRGSPGGIEYRWGIHKFRDFLSNGSVAAASAATQGVTKCFRPVRNYPTVKFMLPAAAAIIDVQ